MTEVGQMVDELQTLRSDLDTLQGNLRRRADQQRVGHKVWVTTNGWGDCWVPFDPPFTNALEGAIAVASYPVSEYSCHIYWHPDGSNRWGLSLKVMMVWKDGDGYARGPDYLGNVWVMIDYVARGS